MPLRCRRAIIDSDCEFARHVRVVGVDGEALQYVAFVFDFVEVKTVRDCDSLVNSKTIITNGGRTRRPYCKGQRGVGVSVDKVDFCGSGDTGQVCVGMVHGGKQRGSGIKEAADSKVRSLGWERGVYEQDWLVGPDP